MIREQLRGSIQILRDRAQGLIAEHVTPERRRQLKNTAEMFFEAAQQKLGEMQAHLHDQLSRFRK